MKSCGVIVEYNPFHNGHLYHLKKAKEKSQADVMIGVMSGNFLQRGEPAFLDKWTRGNEALKNGIDLLVELPVQYSVQPADYFAEGSIRLLQSLGCDALCFGTDAKETIDYEKLVKFRMEHDKIFQQAFQVRKKDGHGLSYPKQVALVWQELFGDHPTVISSPNHVLGMAYAKQNLAYKQSMKLIPIMRQYANFHDNEAHHEKIASATAIRRLAFTNSTQACEPFVPQQTYQDICLEPLVNWENYWQLLSYQLLTKNVEVLQKIYQMVEGIEYRLKEFGKVAHSYEEFIQLVKTKRFTRTRLNRLCTYILLNISKEDMQVGFQNPYIRILGFTEKGREYLNHAKKTSPLPIISNVNKKTESILSLEIRAGKVYQLGNQKILEQDYFRQPIRLG